MNTTDMLCPKCGAETPFNAAFCPRCGAPTEPGINKKFKCASCGVVTDDKPNFCPACGSAFGESTHAPDADVPVCPACGGKINYQIITEKEHVGCGEMIFLLFLAATILGIFIIIPALANRRTILKTYAVCERCGSQTLINTSME